MDLPAKMSHRSQPRAQAQRAPLGDATSRLNNSRQSGPSSPGGQAYTIPHHESLKTNGKLPISDTPQGSPGYRIQKGSTSRYNLQPQPLTSSPANPRLSAISKESQAVNTNRNSQISTTSTTGSDGKSKRKTHIGPWHLGKTLGKGSTARVRMARHATTGQPAAIKIVPKENAKLSQAGSLASLDRMDSALIDSQDGFRRMPYGIEREVAIMKLIDHPHIMKLYDIWENRTEIYMVLEYVENGELFEHIHRSGHLEEEEAMVYFRQVLSAVGYCHSFNICHRDLKPENILLSKEGSVKIADFGMAALHQTPDHKLRTSCGSPHYAAPEVIRGNYYRGDKVDIWSMGVILYASLAGFLPFDHEDVKGLLAVIQIGEYRMAENFSHEAADLIYRMLQLNPRDRLSISQIWEHPLLRKYDYLDDYGGGLNPRSPDIRQCVRPVVRRSEIDRELLRHLRSLWHMFDEQKLIKLLLNDVPNDQKLFYGLLLKHREAQLENYMPEVGYSSSDYHHVRPLSKIQKLSSRQFSQSNTRGHGRQVSRFTVVSNVTKAETEATVKSYDPFKASRPQNLVNPDGPAYANVVVHRGRPSVQDVKPSPRPSHDSGASSAMARNRQQSLAPPKPWASRSSLASSTRSRGSGTGVRAAVGNRRGVSFNHKRKGSGSSLQSRRTSQHNTLAPERHSKFSEVTDDGGDMLRAAASPSDSARYIRSKKATNSASQHLVSVKKIERGSKLWQEDVRQLSSSLAKDCDEAFNRTSVVSTAATKLSSRDDANDRIYETPMSSIMQNEGYGDSITSLQTSQLAPPSQSKDQTLWDTRPLPTPPNRSDSINIELAEARKQAQLRRLSANGDDSPGYLNRMVTHIDRLMQPGSSPVSQAGDRRTASAPVNLKYVLESGRQLPAIDESPVRDGPPTNISDFEMFMDRERVKHGGTARITSAPEPRPHHKSSYHDSRQSRRQGRQSESIRLVLPTSPSPAKPPAPLNIRKKASQGLPIMTGALPATQSHDRRPSGHDLRQQYASSGSKNEVPSNLTRVDENPFNDSVFGSSRTKKPNWFKRNPKSSNGQSTSVGSNEEFSQAYHTNTEVSKRSGNRSTSPIKKKSFGFGRLFGKFKQDGMMTVSSRVDVDDGHSVTDSLMDEHRQGQNNHMEGFDNPRIRQIEPQQTWIARLFHVKPATKFVCFAVSKRRARQEVVTLLREWKKYGARDVIIDKERNIVFGRVGAKNFLHMKEVSFACEIMTVIEHGRRSHLSIARFTQEKGAASSFFKVVETLETVLKSRGMLVSDERKWKMMIKTLNS